MNRRAPLQTSVLVGIALVGGLFASCSNSSTSDTDDLPTTSILVSPQDFLGELVCGEYPGAVRRYQATLLDVTEDLAEPFALPSSELLRCNQTAYFSFVRPGRRYIAQVHAYDSPDLAIQAPGVPLVVDRDGQVVEPRWQTTCYGEDGVDYAVGGAGGAGSDWGVEALLYTQLYVRGCGQLVDSGELGPTGLSFSLESTLVGLSCGAGPGQVERFWISPSPLEPTPPPSGVGGADNAGGAGGLGGSAGGDGGPTPEPVGTEVSCGEDTEIVGLPGGVSLRFYVYAYEAGATTPSWSTSCRGFTTPGVIVPARCDPLQPL